MGKKVWRGFCNFLRSIFSWFLPIQSRCSIPSREIGFSKRVDPQLKTVAEYYITVDGDATASKVKFQKNGDKIYLLEISLPQGEMREHLPRLLSAILHAEKGKVFSTHFLSCASDLRSAGYMSRSVFSYDPEGKELGDLFAAATLKNAKENREKLTAKGKEALERIETDPSMLDSFVDLTRSVLGGRRDSIALADLFSIIDSLRLPIPSKVAGRKELIFPPPSLPSEV